MRLHIKNGRWSTRRAAATAPGDCSSRTARSSQRLKTARADRSTPRAWWWRRASSTSSARLREPGYEYKATLESEMDAAVAGGVTSLACPPDTDPPLDEPGLVDMLRRRALALERARVYPIGALTMKLAGQAHSPKWPSSPRPAASRSRRRTCRSPTRRCCGARCSTPRPSAFPVWLRAEDALARARAASRTTAKLPRASGFAGIPGFAETVALSTILELVRATGARVHVCRLSSRRRAWSSCARAQGRAPAGELRRGHPPRAPVRHGPGLLRLQLPPRAAAAQPARPRRARARARRRHDRLRCAPTTRRSTRTASSCRSPRPSRAPRASSCCCRSRSSGARRASCPWPQTLARISSRAGAHPRRGIGTARARRACRPRPLRPGCAAARRRPRR